MEVAVYYFPSWHVDPRNEAWHGHGWSEWELVKNAQPRFPGHQQPKVPAWGFFNEADPAWAEREVDLAADHGVTAFLYDWYWYNDGPFLWRQLEEGFLRAKNRGRLKFGLMWANHDWRDIFPARPDGSRQRLLASGAVGRAAWEGLTDHVVQRYFPEPNYLRIEGCPYFSILQPEIFCSGLGGPAGARDALRSFREKVARAGFPGLHLSVMAQGLLAGLPTGMASRDEFIECFGLASIAEYTWANCPGYPDLDANGFPAVSYPKVAAIGYADWQTQRQRWPIDYYPNVPMGWDPSPRSAQSAQYENRGYPFCTIWKDNTPDAWRAALQRAKAFVQAGRDKHKMVTLNAWNEWTEGSYLLPDRAHGTAYLEAVRDVFGSESPGAGETPDPAAEASGAGVWR